MALDRCQGPCGTVFSSREVIRDAIHDAIRDAGRAAIHGAKAAGAAAESAISPDGIRALRLRFGLSQAALERLIGAGPKTVVRWERGSVSPNATAATLFRVLRDVPGVFEYLSGANADA